jgi:predicted ribosomally synthesized peptide with SipW-like signal peptide
MTRTQKLLAGLLLVGLLASAAAVTYASFNASVTNGGNRFQTGTLFLGNAGNSTTSACFSYGSAAGSAGVNANSNTCSLSVGLPTSAAPSATITTFVVQLENAGSLPATVSLSGSCTDGAAAGAGFHGPGSLCSTLGMAVQPCASYTGGATCASKQAACTYPASTIAQCASPPAGTISGFAGATYPNILSSWPAGAKQAYEVDLQLPAATGNGVQGMTATFALTWSSVPS